MKRLLLVSYFFPPASGGGVARALSFARYLPLHGWQVTVLCAESESVPLSDPSRETRLPEGVEVIRVPMPPGLARGRRAVVGGSGGRPSGLFAAARSLSRWLLVPDSYAPWRAAAVREAKARIQRGGIAAVLTTSPPDTAHLVGLGLERPGGPPWIADFRDPWIGLAYRRPPTPLHAARQRRMRDAVLARASLVLATTRASCEDIRERLSPESRSKVHHLPNGWEADVTLSPAREEGSPAGGADGEPLRVVYTGTLWGVPATRTCFVGLARALAASPASGRALEVVIAGPHETRERKLASDLGLSRSVRFLGQVPYAESRSLQAAAGVLLLLQVHGSGYEAAIPGKLYEYVASGRPILAFLPRECEAADLVRACGGWVVAPEDERGAEEAFARLLGGERPGGDSPERLSIADAHRRDRLAVRLAELLDALVTRPAGAASGRR